jgi:quercetin dioxygenase-like cupin family protein
MKVFHVMMAAAIIVSSAGAALADATGASMSPAMYVPSAIKWAPGTGPLAGVQVAVLSGDPTKSGPFTMRLNIPDGAKFPAHYHSTTERLTVISGTLLAGLGKAFDASKLHEFPAGSYVVMPAGVWHFAAAKGATIVQIDSDGPFTMLTASSSSSNGK